MTIRPPSSCKAAIGLTLSPYHSPYVRKSYLLTSHWSRQYAVLPPQKQTAPSAVAARPALEIQKPIDRVNPPASTLPPPLDVPERDPDVSLFSYLYKAGKAYVAFYKQGVKNIWGNRTLAREVRSRLEKECQKLAKQRAGAAKSSAQSTNEAKTVDNLSLLSRSDFQLLRRHRSAISRVPLFVLLFACLGEWLPLVAIYFTALMPYPCRIPMQIERSRKKLEGRRLQSFRGQIKGAPPSTKHLDAQLEMAKNTQDKVWTLQQGQAFHVSRSLGLHPRFWDKVNTLYRMWPPETYIRLRIRRYLAYLEQDDQLLRRDGDVRTLSSEEVALACEERGIDVLGKPDGSLRRYLRAWLERSTTGQGQVLRMLLERPSVWAEPQKGERVSKSAERPQVSAERPKKS